MKGIEKVVIGTTSDDHTCRSNEKEIESSRLVFSLKEELENLPPLSSECCIYRIPERLRKQNAQVYTPHLVSIGPYHNNKNKDYVNMEVEKRRYLQRFIDRTGMSLENVVEFIRERETKIRNSYEQLIDLSSDELVKMVLLDAIFVFTFLCGGLEELRVENDRVFGGSMSYEETTLDMLLLENQLPLFIFVDLSKLVLKVDVLTEAAKQSTCIYMHCYETLRTCIKTSNVPMDIEMSDIKHIVDFLRCCLLPSVPLSTTYKYDYEQLVPSATQLHEAGVKFKVALSKNCSLDMPNLLDVQFTNGVLKIPRIYVDFRTETLFRNLLAFEECHCNDKYTTEYIFFMHSLINTKSDVELLVRCKILVNYLEDNEAASNLFNILGNGHISNGDNYYFGTLCEDLNACRNYPIHGWMTILKHDHFNSSWKILYIIVALTLILLTLTWTVFSILSYFNAYNAHA